MGRLCGFGRERWTTMGDWLVLNQFSLTVVACDSTALRVGPMLYRKWPSGHSLSSSAAQTIRAFIHPTQEFPMPQPALIAIDIRTTTSPTGAYPLHDTQAVLERTVQAVRSAYSMAFPWCWCSTWRAGQIALLQRRHRRCADPPAAAPPHPTHPWSSKGHADNFLNTTLQNTLPRRRVDTLWLCGMMTHNCVTHTALTAGQGYTVRVLEDLCTTVDPMVHAIAAECLAGSGGGGESDSLGLRG